MLLSDRLDRSVHRGLIGDIERDELAVFRAAYRLQRFWASASPLR